MFNVLMFLDEKMRAAAYESLRHLFDMNHVDNMKVLRSLIYPRDDIQPLVEGSSKRRVCNQHNDYRLFIHQCRLIGLCY